MSGVPDFVGRVFGPLTVIGRAPPKDYARTWRCACECGLEVDKREFDLLHRAPRACRHARRPEIVTVDGVEAAAIRIAPGVVALVDPCDAHLAAFKWYANRKRGYTTYAVHTPVGAGQKYVFLHRVVLGLTDSALIVDHVNGNGLDCRRSNLRLATVSQNGANRKLQRNNTSGYRGVFWHKPSGSWRAQIKSLGRRYALGSFPSVEAAAKAYDAAARSHFGAFARLNFPEITP